MEYLFGGCYNLKYIDLKQITIPDNSLFTQIIEKNLKNTVICMEDTSSLEKMISLYDWAFINCSEKWGEKIDQIFPNDNNLCINNCLLSKYKTVNYTIMSLFFHISNSIV